MLHSSQYCYNLLRLVLYLILGIFIIILPMSFADRCKRGNIQKLTLIARTKGEMRKTCLGPCLVDVIFFIYKTGESMLEATMRPYIVRTVCEEFFHGNQTYCGSLEMYPDEEDNIQKKAANYLVYYRILVNIPAVFLGLFCGAWSDKYGRKIPMMIPSLGSVLSVLFYLMSKISTTWSIPLILIGALVQGMFGKSAVITMAVNSYVSDITEPEERTGKFGKLLGMNFFGLTAGALLSGILQEWADFNFTLCVVVFLHAAVVLVTILFVEERISPKDDPDDFDHVKSRSEYLDIFRLSNIVESLSVLIKRRAGCSRKIIIILCIMSLVNMSCKAGEIDITVLFTKRSPFNWNESLFAYLLSLDYAVMGFSLVLILPVFSSFFKFQDITIIILGMFCKICRCTWGGLATSSWMIYTSVIVGAFAGMMTSSIRSALSKEVSENELGKTFAILSCGETLSKLLGTLIFTNIYSATTYIFPGFAFMIEAFVYFALLLLAVWLMVLFQKSGRVNLGKIFDPRGSYGSTYSIAHSPPEPENEIDELENEPASQPQPLTATTP